MNGVGLVFRLVRVRLGLRLELRLGLECSYSTFWLDYVSIKYLVKSWKFKKKMFHFLNKASLMGSKLEMQFFSLLL